MRLMIDYASVRNVCRGDRSWPVADLPSAAGRGPLVTLAV